MKARIYRPAKTAMQSGTAKSRWLLEYVPEQARQAEPLMGWISSGETLGQVKLWFDSKEDAVAYATRHGIPHQVEDAKSADRRTMAYSDNFRFNRVGSWTH